MRAIAVADTRTSCLRDYTLELLRQESLGGLQEVPGNWWKPV